MRLLQARGRRSAIGGLAALYQRPEPWHGNPGVEKVWVILSNCCESVRHRGEVAQAARPHPGGS